MKLENDFYIKLASIGFNVNFEGKRTEFADIEKTLLLAIENIPNDARLLSLILSWVKFHGSKINIERLAKLSGKKSPVWLGAAALFGLYCKQHRWKKLILKPKEITANGNLASNRSRANLKGEEQWSKDSGYIIPLGSEPIKEKWILPSEQLAKVNKHYRNKLIYGSNWRADIATAIEMGAKNPYQVAKICQCSYEPAHRIFNDFVNAGAIAKVG